MSSHAFRRFWSKRNPETNRGTLDISPVNARSIASRNFDPQKSFIGINLIHRLLWLLFLFAVCYCAFVGILGKFWKSTDNILKYGVICEALAIVLAYVGIMILQCDIPMAPSTLISNTLPQTLQRQCCIFWAMSVLNLRYNDSSL